MTVAERKTQLIQEQIERFGIFIVDDDERAPVKHKPVDNDRMILEAMDTSRVYVEPDGWRERLPTDHYCFPREYREAKEAEARVQYMMEHTEYFAETIKTIGAISTVFTETDINANEVGFENLMAELEFDDLE